MKEELTKLSGVFESHSGGGIAVYDEDFLLKVVRDRMAATGMATMDEYSLYARECRLEAELLTTALNISYSDFFRNHLTWALLEQFCLPKIIAGKSKGGRGEIRAWSAGCAAGQEAYSLAILLEELISERYQNVVSYRIFATDHSATVLELARSGSFDSSDVGNVRLRHLEKFFTRRDGRYRISDRLRERIDFSLYDLLDERSSCPAESIYGDFDLVLCGNLLFYYKPGIRGFILDKICRGLGDEGFLITGEAEREIVSRHECFRMVYPFSAVFRKTPGGAAHEAV